MSEDLAEYPIPKFRMGAFVRKKSGASWCGHVVGTYSTKLTPEGYCIESSRHPGSVQIYPAAALELAVYALEMEMKQEAENADHV